MTQVNKPSPLLRTSVWIAQVLLAALMLSGAVLKWLPVAQSAAMMPWMGQVPLWQLRLLGVLDFLGAAGILLPSLLRFHRLWVVAAATGIALLMLSAIIFHVSRGEASVIGFNIFLLLLAAFVAWARFYKVAS